MVLGRITTKSTKPTACSFSYIPTRIIKISSKSILSSNNNVPKKQTFKYYYCYHVAPATNRRIFSTHTTAATNHNSDGVVGSIAKNTNVTTTKVRKRNPMTLGLIALAFGVTGYGMKHLYVDIAGGTLEGLERSIIFYSFGIPKYVLYRWYMYLYPNDHDELWDELNTRTSQQGLQIILQLQGFYIKCGQLCASNVGNSFPKIWQDTMSILQDQCPYQDYKIVEQIIKNEYHINDVHEIFESIDPIPIGAASIGQVHRALLKVKNSDTATKTIPVVIKVCYPNAERLLRGDVRTIKLFAQMAQPVHVPGIIEMEKQFATEFNYQLEGQHLDIVRRNLIKAGLCQNDDDKTKENNNALCTIPKPYLDYCTKSILVMEELKGDKLVVALRKNAAKLAKLAGYGDDIEKFIQDQQQRFNKEDDQSTPSSKQYEYIRAYDKIRQLYANISNGLYDWTIGMFVHSHRGDKKDDNDWSILNHAKLIDDLVYIHGHEVLIDGVFNSDPHPGNILLCRNPCNGQPQLGLIDYGQVKRLSKESRHLFAKLIIALADDSKDQIISLMHEAGYKSKYMNPNNIYVYAKVYYDQDNKTLTGGLHIQMFMEHLQSIDPISEIPREFIPIGRTSIVLRGLAHSLHQPRSIAKAWKPIAERVLAEDI